MSITKERQQELFIKLANIAEELGWVIGLPEEEEIAGLIIGNEEFLSNIADAYSKGLEIYKKTSNSNNDDNNSGGNSTFH